MRSGGSRRHRRPRRHSLAADGDRERRDLAARRVGADAGRSRACCPSSARAAGAACSSARLQHERRPDPLPRPESMLGRAPAAACPSAVTRHAARSTACAARRRRTAGTMPLSTSPRSACRLLGCCPSTLPMSCRAQARRIEDLRRELLDVARRLRLRARDAAAARAHRVAAVGHRPRARPEDLQAGRPAQRPHARRLRADTTPQVARIDAHLLNRAGVARLCYCGPVLHTRPAGLHAIARAAAVRRRDLRPRAARSRPRGPGPGARLPASAGVARCDARPGRCAHRARRARRCAVPMASSSMRSTPHWPPRTPAACELGDARAVRATRRGLHGAAALYGGDEVLEAARDDAAAAARDRIAPSRPGLAGRVMPERPIPRCRSASIWPTCGGNAYYSGARFALYAAGSSDALARGGRYDEVGAVFGRNRPAVGFSLDLKALAELARRDRAARCDPRALGRRRRRCAERCATLRERGETVVCALPGHEHEARSSTCDRELVAARRRMGRARAADGGDLQRP